MFLLILAILAILGLTIALFVMCDDFEVAAALAGAVWFVAFLAVAGIGMYHQVATQNACLQLGYPGNKVTLGGFGDAYCIAREDQTDVVVPLGKAVPR
jgi:hypothetical protein